MPEAGLAPTAEVVLPVGGVWFGREGRVGTLLGSCVAVTLWHPVSRAGGMCHFVLPSRGPRDRDRAVLVAAAPDVPDGPERPEALDGRYGDEAVALLLRHVQATGTRPDEYDVALLGGGNQFTGRGSAEGIDVPSRNVAAARRLLGDAGLVVRREDVGGTGPRRVVLDLTDGRLSVQRVAPTGRTRP